jgi:uncharacterized membrane protein YqiK
VYEVETKGVYIQDVVFPQELVTVLTRREIANQERATFEEQQRAQTARIEMEKAKGTADMQGQLASAQVGVEIRQNQAKAREAEAQGEAAYVELTGKAEATKTQAIGLAEAKAVEALGIARATGFEQQRQALGPTATAVVAVANAVSEGHIDVMPDVLVTGGGGSFEGLAATLMRAITNGQGLAGNGQAGNGPAGNPPAGNGPGAPKPAIGRGGPAEAPTAVPPASPETPLEADEGGRPVGPDSA